MRSPILDRSPRYYLLIGYALELFALIAADIGSDHLELAKSLLNEGKYNDALAHLHGAINNDPDNYVTYFKRATVFLALNRPNSALDDLNKALELRPEFRPALVQRANLHLKLGNLDNAHLDYEHCLRLEPTSEQDRDRTGEHPGAMLNRIEWLKNEIRKASDLVEDGQLDAALSVMGPIIELIPFSAGLLSLRADAYERLGEAKRAINDYRTIARLNVDTASYLKMARLLYKTAEIEQSLDSVRECLKLDPDHKSCLDFYRPLKKLNKHLQQMLSSERSRDDQECLDQGSRALAYVEESLGKQSALIYSIQSVMCHCSSRAGDVQTGPSICAEALLKSHEAGLEGVGVGRPELLCDMADLLADQADYESALKLYKESLAESESRRAREGLDRMQRLLSQAARRDYYKILGVSRRADEEEINRAYRRLAAKWHPDRHQGEQSKKKAQAMFMDIAEAKAVLTDPDKRRRFDHGEDPLDAQAGRQHQARAFYRDAFASSFKFDFDFDFDFD